MCRLHDARAAAGQDVVALPAVMRVHGPLGQTFAQITGHAVVVATVADAVIAGLNARRAPEGDGALNAVVAQALLGLQILSQDAQRARILAMHERRIFKGFAHAVSSSLSRRAISTEVS